jgi:hypothetical protein
MKFDKDILVMDFEGREAPIQIGVVLLDKETLEEKDHYVSYIYADLHGVVSPVSGITQEMIDGAPSQEEVGKILHEKFGTDIFLAPFVSNLDIEHHTTLMRAANIDPESYDYHVLDIWPLAYLDALKGGYTGGPRSEGLFQYYGGDPRGLHDALEDARLAAMVLRKIVFGKY